MSPTNVVAWISAAALALLCILFLAPLAKLEPPRSGTRAIGKQFKRVDPNSLANMLALFAEGTPDAFFPIGVIVQGATREVLPHADREARITIAKGLLLQADIDLDDVNKAVEIYRSRYKVVG